MGLPGDEMGVRGLGRWSSVIWRRRAWLCVFVGGGSVVVEEPGEHASSLKIAGLIPSMLPWCP